MTASAPDFCPICKHHIGPNDLTCAHCGYTLLTVCSGCHHVTQTQFTYCPFCGRPLHTPEIEATYQALAQQVQDQQLRVQALQGRQRQLEKYLPTGLLDKVLLSNSDVVAERRYVTVLFVDVVGFTELSGHLDPEDVFLMMNRCFRTLADQVYRYGGAVDKFIGDAMMALFGAPTSYGNDSERAVRAALEMQAAMRELNQELVGKLGQPLQIRIGITSGDVIAGTVGVETQWSYTVMGSTVNTASRLQSAAGPGRILVNEDIYQQTHTLFQYQALPPMTLKGVGDAVPVFEVLGRPRGGLEDLTTTQAQSPFVGRDDILQQLESWGETIEGGKGQLLIITGPAGIGKTRLVQTWLPHLAPQTQRWWGSAQNLSQQSYAIWREAILRGLQLQGAPRQTVAAVLLEQLGEETWLPYLEALLFGEMLASDSLGALEPDQLKQQIFVALRRLLISVVRRRPLMLVFDNLQWADPLSLELLTAGLDLSRGWPISFCLVARGDAQTLPPLEAHAAEQQGLSWHRLELPPLPPPDSEALLRQVLPIAEMPPALKAYILKQAQNNPYYLEELVAFVKNSGLVHQKNGRWLISDAEKLDQLRLPDSLRGLIQTRLDQLPEVQRQILTYGAVIGPSFPAALLFDVLRQIPHLSQNVDQLDPLVAQGILRFDGASYHFVHNSLHEVIYQTLLQARRRSLHRQIAEALEQRVGQQAWAEVEQLAYHFAEAQIAAKAIPYLMQAGAKFKQRFANDAALHSYRTALTMLPQVPALADQAAEIQQALGDLYQQMGDYDEALEAYELALKEGTGFNQDADYCCRIGQVWQWKGEIDEARQWFDAALQTARRKPDEVEQQVLGNIYVNLCLLNMRSGDPQSAESWGRQAVDALAQTDALGALATSYNSLGGAYYLQNRWRDASAQVEQALKIRRQIGDQLGLAGSLSNLGILYTSGGEWHKAVDVFQQSIAMCEEIGALERTLSNAHNNVAYVYIHQGKLDQAETHLRQSLKIKEQTGAMLHATGTLNNLALVALMRHDLSTALAEISRSQTLCQESNDTDYLSEALWYAARIHLARGEFEAAENTSRQAIELAQSIQSRLNEGGALRVLARLQLRQRNLAAANDNLSQSLNALNDTNNEFELARTKLVLAELALTRNEPETYQQLAASIEPIFSRLEARPSLEELRYLQQQVTPHSKG